MAKKAVPNGTTFPSLACIAGATTGSGVAFAEHLGRKGNPNTHGTGRERASAPQKGVQFGLASCY
ncbi:MAG: hypothetical protein F6K30_06375 [Cyanothece sp. SIO2G6]|nr:hypothetical protein [Cyanothece sp. SIO2G6]